MLQRVPFVPQFKQTELASVYIGYDDIVRFLRRHARMIVTSTAVTMLAALGYLATSRPLYSARAQLLIDARPLLTAREQSGEAITTLDTPQVESHMMVLRSERIMTRLIRTLDLENDVEFKAPVVRWFGLPAQQANTDLDHMRLIIARLEAGLDVRRAGLSYALDISFSWGNPEKAALIANAFADTFVQDQLATRAQAAQQGSVWLEARIDELRKLMNASALMVQEFRAKRDYRIVSRRDVDGQQQIRSVTGTDPPGTVTEHQTLEELESKASTYRKIYESFLQAYAESVQRQSYPVASARVITLAMKPHANSHPKSALVMLLATLFGGLAGMTIAVFQHSTDRTVRSGLQLRDEVGIECLAVLPKILGGDPPDWRRSIDRWLRWVGGASKRAQVPSSQTQLHLDEVKYAPFSPFSDAINGLKTSISIASRAKPLKSIGITSPQACAGTTMLAANFATLLAITKHRCLLIDGDLHNSTLTSMMAPTAKTGLIEALTGSIGVQDCIVPYGPDGLHFLPVAKMLDVRLGADLLGSDAMRRLLQDLHGSYDTIIVGLPPLHSSASCRAICMQLDGTIMAVEWARTPMQMVVEDARLLRAADARLIGSVLTEVSSSVVAEHVDARLGVLARV